MSTLSSFMTANARHKIIGFDVDGVIIDSLIPVHKAFQIYASRYNLADQITLEYVRKYCMVGTPRHIISRFLNNFRSLLEHQGVDLESLLGDKLAEEAGHWETSYQKVEIDPIADDQAIQLLIQLQQSNYVVPLISSGTQTEITKNLAILEKRYQELVEQGDIQTVEKLYDTVVCWNEVEPYGKPHPKSMEIALEKLRKSKVIPDANSIPTGIIFIGDGASDIKFAHNIGGYGFYLESTTPFQGEKDQAPHLTFRDIKHLRTSLQDLIVGDGGLEPPASASRTQHSSHLS